MTKSGVNAVVARTNVVDNEHSGGHAVQPSEVARQILGRYDSTSSIRVLLAGPAGVGKSATASAMCTANTGLVHIEHDTLKTTGEWPCPCSVSYFDLRRCFEPSMHLPEFVIDTGGGSIFVPGKDNDARVRDMHSFKEDHHLEVCLLTASHDVVKERHLRVPGSREDAFDDYWQAWESVELQCWQACSDFTIDIS